jgi:hypothetical protein
MPTATALFRSHHDAHAAIDALKESGVDEKKISILLAGDRVSDSELHTPLTLKTAGAAVGGVLGAGAATFLIPGIGPIAGVGLIASALAGIGLGAAAGGVVEKATHGVPHEDLYFHEETLRAGGSIVFVETRDDDETVRVRNLLERHGGRPADAVRQEWWRSLRGAGYGGDERDFRSGFEAALHPATRGRAYEEVSAYLESCYPEPCGSESFRLGYASGQDYFRSTRGGGGETF